MTTVAELVDPVIQPCSYATQASRIGHSTKVWHAHAGSVLPIVQKILRSLKHTEDATAESASPNIYMLCDMALAVASAVVKSQQSSKAKGKQPSSAATAVPGNVPLPASFYRSLDIRTSGEPCVHVWSDLLPMAESLTACTPLECAWCWSPVPTCMLSEALYRASSGWLVQLVHSCLLGATPVQQIMSSVAL